MRNLIIISLVIFSPVFAFAQKSGSKKAGKNSSTSLEPAYPKVDYAPKKSKKSSKGPTYESEQEFYERLASLEKQKRKNEKEMLKPQYSDPMYFGHKRPPKKRKPGKMKFCKECGMRH
jgi:hypothetical protein